MNLDEMNGGSMSSRKFSEIKVSKKNMQKMSVFSLMQSVYIEKGRKFSFGKNFTSNVFSTLLHRLQERRYIFFFHQKVIMLDQISYQNTKINFHGVHL